ncbi:glycoside hydrolase family 30 protein [Amanita thiersii Skay4041]|uniref:Glycoside hydrolase family 30 protein n=1 Tax=Amanita thiersii Skay4041 TaxID=703135 RepID=A0A2A9NWT9_9AGAR|nr:glycoside hydrolase family 30 protein [Amanita thiersii Skay4041]
MPLSSLLISLVTLLPSIKAASVSSTAAQTFLGVGGSGAWWPNDLYHFPDATRQNLSSMLFSPQGLGLSSYRYNIGGGGVNVSNPTRAPETFYVSPGVYNWSADAQGVYFLLQAAQFHVPITAFANTAPAPLTSGKASCNGGFVSGTGNQYGTFLADVIAHFRGQGVNISYVSAMNEPDSSFGPSPCGQEGMLVRPDQRAEVVNGVWNALSAKGLTSSVGILADESSSLGNALNEYASWLPQVKDKVAALVHHTYDFPSDTSYTNYVNTVKSQYPGKVTWMSEICCSLGNADGTGKGWSGGYDPTIKNALMFSSLVFQSFILAGEPHYDFWTLVSNQLGCSPLSNPSCPTAPNSNGWTDGLIYYDPSYATNRNFQLYVTKHYWAYKHFGNFVKPGSQRRPITGSDAGKFNLAVATSTNFYILAMNPTTSDSTLSLTFPETVCGTVGHRTSASEDFAQVAAATSTGGNTWSLPFRATSLTTYEFKRGSC